MDKSGETGEKVGCEPVLKNPFIDWEVVVTNKDQVVLRTWQVQKALSASGLGVVKVCFWMLFAIIWTCWFDSNITRIVILQGVVLVVL